MKKLIVFIGMLALTSYAYAGPVTMTFVGFQPGGWQAGYPYLVTVNGTVTNVMCDDWEHGGLPGDIWQANFTNLGTSDLSLLRFNQAPGALTLYKEAGWLILQTAVTPQSQWTDINFAVWYTFDSTVPLTTGAQNWVDLAQQEASNGFPGVNFYRVGIYTPVDQYDTNMDDAQEFLRVVPEPGSLILLGTGLVGLLSRKLRG